MERLERTTNRADRILNGFIGILYIAHKTYYVSLKALENWDQFHEETISMGLSMEDT